MTCAARETGVCGRCDMHGALEMFRTDKKKEKKKIKIISMHQPCCAVRV